MIEVQRSDDGQAPVPWWCPLIRESGRRDALLKCPNGHIGILDTGPDGHSIYRNGLVSPSVVCPEDGCNFHDHVRLLEWQK